MPEAKFEWYKCLEDGRGVEKNGAEADTWLEKAAGQGVEAARVLWLGKLTLSCL